MGIIFLASAQPTLPSVPGLWDLLVKKTMHALAYGLLTWLVLRALRDQQPRGSWSDDLSIRALSAGLVMLYALSDEYHQTFVPGRRGSWVDVAIDGLGVSSVILLDWLHRTERCPGGEGASG
jgi:VanZ family protein